ncbi:MAG: hypothetical protein AAF387_04340 [Pseudomonadota bacterium]
MKFAHNGYYIEKYIKCDNCGVLIYDDGIAPNAKVFAGELYCSTWCREWRREKSKGVDSPVIEQAFNV